MAWAFYGREQERMLLLQILQRRRWFFLRITGRRRIGKTTLVQRGLAQLGAAKVFYLQIPDSAPAGVLSTVHDAMVTFGLPAERYPRPATLLALARTIEQLAHDGFIVVLDEFQYFSRKHLFEFTSHLQAVVDRLSADAWNVPGGLIVLGSIHAELVALLEDRNAPLFNRVTDQLELRHLEFGSLLEILRTHADHDPERLLFLWNLFEGVPKFYRDAYEQGVLAGSREEVLGAMFFRSSSPLRTEADQWFLSELRGRYDVVLKYVSRNPGCANGDIEAHVREISPNSSEQAGGYLKILIERYQMLERKQPIFAKPNARSGRYYVRDNFLRSWLAALQSPVSALQFRPEADLVRQADARLHELEGFALERLAGQLYEERSRRGLPGFSLTHRIDGYWDRGGVEIDLIAVDEDSKTIRFGSCKRNPAKLLPDVAVQERHVAAFLAAHPRYRDWTQQRVAIAPVIDADVRAELATRGVIAQDIPDLLVGL